MNANVTMNIEMLFKKEKNSTRLHPITPCSTKEFHINRKLANSSDFGEIKTENESEDQYTLQRYGSFRNHLPPKSWKNTIFYKMIITKSLKCSNNGWFVRYRVICVGNFFTL